MQEAISFHQMYTYALLEAYTREKQKISQFLPC